MQITLAELKSFFEENPLAQDAAHSIRNGREIGLTIKAGENFQETADFTFAKEGGKNVVRSGTSTNPDVVFLIPEPAARELVTRKFDSVGQVGLHIFEKILSNDPAQKIQIRLKAGVLSMVTGGYFGVLTAGGGEVAKFMASRGLGNLGKLKDAISKMRS